MTQRVLGGPRSGFRLFNVFGIEIRLDPSVAIIFGLIVYSLGSGLFPQWHPDWTASATWLTAMGAGVAFFASLLAHELSHSLVARRYGIRVPRITLFLFGGMAEIESEAGTPQAEFAIAIAGPLMSAGLAGLFSGLASASIDGDTLALLVVNPTEGMQQLGPVTTACIWLGSVNLMLAMFNLIPGFPLDGGRVFRALIWRLTGNQMLATRMASTAGRWFGWGIMVVGLYNLVALKSLGGLWLIFIGWFLSHLASASYSQALTQRVLTPMSVADLMRTRFDTVPPYMRVAEFVDQCLLRSDQQLWPVVNEGHTLGTVTLAGVAHLAPGERNRLLLVDVMTGLDDSPTLNVNDNAMDALQTLLAAGDRPLAVVQEGTVVGLLRSSDVLKWVMLQQQPER